MNDAINEEPVEPQYCRVYTGLNCGIDPPRRFITREWIDWFMEKHDGIPSISVWTAVSRGAKRLLEEEFAEPDWPHKEAVCAPNQATEGREDVEIYIYHVERTRV